MARKLKLTVLPIIFCWSSSLFGQATLSQVFLENNPTGDSNPTSLIEMNGRVFFVANQHEIYEVTEGLETTKISVKNILGSSFSTQIAPLPVVNKIFLSAFNFDSYGVEPALLNPNTGEIESVGGFISEAYSAQVGTMVTLNDRVIFSANENNVWSLWSTNGTVENTVQLINGEDFPSASFQYFDFIQTKDYTYLEKGGTLWITDGTPEGTFSREDFNSFFLSKPNVLTSSEGYVYSVTRTYTEPQVYEIWRFSNDINDAEKVHEFEATTTPNASVEIIGGSPYFAYNTFSSGSWNCYLYELNEITLDISLVKQFTGTIDPLNSTGAQAFFQITNPSTSSTTFWRTRGTEETTIKLIDQDQLNSVLVNSALGDKILFNSTQAPKGTETWVSDGTVEGTIQLIETYPGPLSGAGSYRFGSEILGKIFFQAKSPTYGTEFWVTDGTPEGTAFLGDINENPSPAKGSRILANGSELFVVGTVSNTSEPNLFKYSIVSAELESVLNKDIIAAVFASNILPYNNKIYFGGSLQYHPNAESEFSLLLNYGESGITTPLRDQFANTFPGNFREVNELLFFTASTMGNELWVTDGTDENTHLVKNIAEGYLSAFDGFSGSENQKDLPITYHSGKYYFAANDQINGNEIWISDLSEENTTLFLDVNPGSVSSNPRSFFSFGSLLLFSATDDLGADHVYASDGITESLEILSAEEAIDFFLLDDGLYYLTRSGVTFGFSYYKLWKTDGSSAGTSLVFDLNASFGKGLPAVKTDNGILVAKSEPGTSKSDFIFIKNDGEVTTLKSDQSQGIHAAVTKDNGAYYFSMGKLFYTNGTTDHEILTLPGDLVDQYSITQPTLMGPNLFFLAGGRPNYEQPLWKIALDAQLEVTLNAEPIESDQAVNFGSIRYNNESATKTFNIKNTGFIDWEFSNGFNLQVSGDAANDFSIINSSFPAVLKPGESFDIDAKFAPTNGGLREATIRLESTDELLSFIDINLNGTGTDFPQTIQSAIDANIPFSNLPLELNATASSGLPLFFTSSDSEVAIFVDGKLVPKKFGTTTITIRQPGNEYFSAANSVEIPVTIVIGEQVITLTSGGHFTFGDAPFSLSSTSSSGNPASSYTSSNSELLSINGKIATILGAGQVSVKASVDGNDFFKPAEQSFNISINKAPQTITFPAIEAKTFGDAAFALAASSTSGLAVTLSSSNDAVATISDGKVTILKAGSAVITASQVGNDNYLAAEAVAQTLTINKAQQSVAFEPLADATFGASAVQLTASSSSGLPVAFTSSDPAVASVDGTSLSILKAGSITVTATQAGNDNYAAASAAQALTINKATQTIAFGELPSLTTSDESIPLSAEASSGLPVTFNSSDETVAVVDRDVLLIVGGGETIISASQAGDENYLAAEAVSRSLVVEEVTGVGSGLAELVSVYPNPTNNYIEVEAEAKTHAFFFTLSRIGGEVVRDGQVLTGSEKPRIYLEDLSVGVYLLTIRQGNDLKVFRVIKQ